MLELRDFVPHPTTSDDDHSAYVKLAVAIFTVVSVLMLGARGLSRWPWKDSYGHDDTAAVLATITAIVEAVLVVCATDVGLGKTPDLSTSSAARSAIRLIKAGNAIFLVAVFASKLSVALCLCRLSRVKKHRMYTWSIVAACAVFFVVCIIAVTVQPVSVMSHSNDRQSTIRKITASWAAYTTLSSILDIIIVIYPVYLVSGLQMPASSKRTISLGFGLRLVAIPLSILRLLSLIAAIRSKPFLFSYGSTEIWTQAELAYAVASATVPCLHPYLNSAQTGLFDPKRGDSWVLPNRQSVMSKTDISTRSHRDSTGAALSPQTTCNNRATVDDNDDGLLGISEMLQAPAARRYDV